MAEFKNQHYLPQFYLRGFERPEAPGQVRLLRSGQLHWAKVGIKNVAAQDYFHSFVDEAGNLDHTLEKELSKLENQFSPALAKLLVSASSRRFPLSDEEHVHLAWFCMMMWQRVPAKVEFSEHWRAEMVRFYFTMTHRFYTEHPEALERLKEERRRDPDAANLDEARPEHFDPAHIEVSVDRHTVLVELLQSAFETAEVLLEMDWVFLRSRPPHFFITSDHPFCLVDPTETRRWRGVGLKNPSVEVTLPLSREVALLARWGRPWPWRWSRGVTRRWRSASEGVVAKINWRTAGLAARELITPVTDFAGASDIQKVFMERAQTANKKLGQSSPGRTS